MRTTANIYTFRGLSVIVFFLASIVSAFGFFWPLVIDANGGYQNQINQYFFYAAAPIALSILIMELSNSRLDAKSVALLGVLAALTAALRPFGIGAIGIEPMWFILILSARVFGPSFGFILGITSLFVSACLTGGFGPWLAYQMFAAGWIGMGAGLLPGNSRTRRGTIRGKWEIFLLVLYSIFAAFLFGLLMDLQFWPWVVGADNQLSYTAGASINENLHRFLIFHFATSMAWDVPRAIFTSILVLVTASPVLNALRRTQRRAAFLTPIEFSERVKAQTEL